MKKGDVIVNFELVEQINSIDELVKELKEKPSIFWRFKVMPTAFFYSWQLRQVEFNLKHGLFWKIKRIE